MSTDYNQEKMNKLLNSLSGFTMGVIIIVSFAMCIGIVAMDSLQITSEADVEEQRLEIRDYTYDRLEVFEDFAFEYENTIDQYVTLIENELDFNIDNEYSSIYSILEEHMEENEATLNTYLGLESKEMLLVPEQRLPDEYDPTGRPWYSDTVENGINWTEMYMDASSGEFIITLSAPVRDIKSGELLGVIGVDVQANELLLEVNNWQVSERGYFTIIDDSSTVLNHPDSGLVGMLVPVEEINNFILSGNEGTIMYEWNGEERVADIIKFEHLGLNFVHLDYALSNKLLPINFGFIAIFIIGTILILVLVMQKTKWVKKQINNGDIHHGHSYTMETKSMNQTKLKQISEELRITASKLEELS